MTKRELVEALDGFEDDGEVTVFSEDGFEYSIVNVDESDGVINVTEA